MQSSRIVQRIALCFEKQHTAFRYEGLCQFLASERSEFEVSVLSSTPSVEDARSQAKQITVTALDTIKRHGEQLIRRLRA
jgi:hypothetical protein